MKGKVLQILKYVGLFLLAFFVISVGVMFFLLKTQGEDFIYITPKVFDAKTLEVFTIGFPEKIKEEGKTLETYSTRFIFNSLKTEKNNYVLEVSKRETYHNKENTFYYDVITSNIEISKDQVKNPDEIQTLVAGNMFDAKVTYEVNKNSFMYFLNYYSCGIQKVFANIFDLNVPCRRGLCQVSYIKPTWEFVAYDEESKKDFISQYEKEDLIIKLSSFFLADEWGYLATPMKSMYQESIMPGGGYGLIGIAYDKSQNLKDATKIWGMYLLSSLQKGNYEYYKDLDIEEYMYTNYQGADFPKEIVKDFMNCKSAYFTIKNLESCTSTECNTMKTTFGEFCSRSIVKMAEYYNEKFPEYLNTEASSVNVARESFGPGIENYYPLSVSSELVYAMKIEKLLNVSLGVDPTIEKAKNYYNSAVNFYNNYPRLDQFLPLCYLMNSSVDMYNETKDNKYLTDANAIYEGIDDVTYLCSGDNAETFCNRSSVFHFVCADAMLNYAKINKETEPKAREYLNTVFYTFYSESPIAQKLLSYDNAKKQNRSGEGLNLPEYGYFGSTVKNGDNMEFEEGFDRINYADIVSSAYFIYLLLNY